MPMFSSHAIREELTLEHMYDVFDRGEQSIIIALLRHHLIGDFGKLAIHMYPTVHNKGCISVIQHSTH